MILCLHGVYLNLRPSGEGAFYYTPLGFLHIAKKPRRVAPSIQLLHINFGQCVRFLTPGHFRSGHQVKLTDLATKKFAIVYSLQCLSQRFQTWWIT